MTYTEEQAKIFNEVFNFEHSMTAIAPCQLTTDGKVEEVGAYEIKGDSKLRATLNIPGHTVDEMLWGNTAAETILMCTDAFDVFLATGDWKKAYLVVEDYIGF